MKEKVIFIHIPKTGGTTINAAMNNSLWQTEVGFNYRHILPNKKSNSGDIFDPNNLDQYRNYKVFMMLRDPIDRMISEYYFIKERKEFTDLIRNKPKDFKAYINSKQTQNGVVNFLKGRRMYDTHLANSNDLEDVISTIDNIPICIGIFESFAASLNYIKNETGITWKKNIDVKRMTFKRPKAAEVSDEIRNLILEKNQLDLALYEHGLEKFEALNSDIKTAKVSFNKDKYNHVLPYCAKWCFFEFCMDNKKFIKQNFNFFKSLTFYLINDKGIRDGKIYTKTWNDSFLNMVSHQFPNSDFTLALYNAYNKNEDDLEQTSNIAKALDDFFMENKNKAHEFYKPLTFKRELVVLHQKKGFFNKLFGN